MPSIVFISRDTGKPVAESFAARLKREGAHAAHYETLHLADWLDRYSRLVREAGGVEPDQAAFIAAMSPPPSIKGERSRETVLDDMDEDVQSLMDRDRE
jgi:hypothetical protein